MPSPRRVGDNLRGEGFRSIHEDTCYALREDKSEGLEQQDSGLRDNLEKGVIGEARANGAVLEEGAGASIVAESLNDEFTQLTPCDPLLLKYGLALSSGYRSLSEASINHFMCLRTDLKLSVRRALESAGENYYAHLSSILGDARRLCLINSPVIDSSFDHWHIPRWGERLVERYGYHYNGMMNRTFPGIHPMTVYDLNDGCLILITPTFDYTRDVTAVEAIPLWETLGFRIASTRGDRGTGSVGLTVSLSQRIVPMIYYLTIKANSVLRRHARGKGMGHE